MVFELVVMVIALESGFSGSQGLKILAVKIPPFETPFSSVVLVERVGVPELVGGVLEIIEPHLVSLSYNLLISVTAAVTDLSPNFTRLTEVDCP